MHTTDPHRITQLTADGLWGVDTLHGLLAAQVAKQPSALAVADQPNKAELTGNSPVRLSFAALDIASDALAAQLLDHGLGEGSRIMVQLPNISELLVCFFAASKLGAVLSPMPVQYGAHEIQMLAEMLEPALFVACPNFRGEDLSSTVRDTLPDIPVLCVGQDIDCLATVLTTEANDALRQHQLALADDANRIITVCWTSGTTGTPKGVPRSHNMWLATARATAEAAEYQSGERLLNPFPLVNMAAIGGFLYAAAELGCALFLHHPFDPPLYLQQIQDEQINFTIAPPAVLNQLAAKPELWNAFDFKALRAIGSGSAPLSPAMIAKMENDYGKPVINFYGSNEGIALFATPHTAATPSLRASCFPRFGVAEMPWDNYVQRAVRSKIIDPDSGETIEEAGRAGELCFAGATVFDGYLGVSNDGIFTPDGYFRTGDLVEICGEPPHYYQIVGRCKDIINRGGMKISPAEIDTLLEGYPGLTEAAVCGYPDSALGEKICACIVVAQEHSAPDLDAICHYLSECGIAKFKLPERLAILTALPRNPMGKIVRAELQAALLTATNINKFGQSPNKDTTV